MSGAEKAGVFESTGFLLGVMECSGTFQRRWLQQHAGNTLNVVGGLRLLTAETGRPRN